MDVKALAKSKRDHTRHLNKKHHGNKHKPPSQSSSSSSPNNAAKEPLSKKHQSIHKEPHRLHSQGSSALPTNWDRYEDEEFDSVPETASKTLDVVVPKSKGADFRHLVAEAQSQADKTLDNFHDDDLLPWEFGVGLCSMLAVRGGSILTWADDDNFVVQDKTIASREASLISLNLHAIAEKIAKVDLSKRLFIESDLLPTELCVEDLAVGSNEEPEEQETTEDSELAKRMYKELNLDDFSPDQSTYSSCSSHAASTSTMSNDILIPVYNVNVECQKVGSSGSNKHATSEDTVVKNSTFEAAAAEKELDMLLDSLDGTKSGASCHVSLGVSTVPPQISNKVPIPSKFESITASLDDALDDLLEETSTLMNPNALLLPLEEKPGHHGLQSSSQSECKSKVSDDFDSWFDTL